MFAQAISSTAPTAASSTSNAVPSCGLTNASRNVSTRMLQSLQTAAVYYYTPTEAKQHGFAVGQAVRLGGQVLRGTFSYDGAK